MLEQGVISPVTGPASWCSGIIVVPKPNVAVITDIDPTHLNKAVQREVYPVSSAEESSAALVNSKIFSKLDAKSGFWQTPLSKESRLLTTFVTPFGRLCLNRLPFGICSASELFRRTVSEILADVEAVICHTDDILSHAADQTTRDSIGRQVLRKLSDAGLSLSEKGECSKEAITFLVHITDGNGIRPEPEKIAVVSNFPPPTTVTELQRCFGMTSQPAKFMPKLAQIKAQLRQLLRKDQSWIWDEAQATAFKKTQDLLTSPYPPTPTPHPPLTTLPRAKRSLLQTPRRQALEPCLRKSRTMEQSAR